MNHDQLMQIVKRDECGNICLTVLLMENLTELVQGGFLTDLDMEFLAKQRCGGTLGRKLREYLYLRKTEALRMDEKEIFATLVYKTSVDKDAPVYFNDKLISCPGLGVAAGIEPIFVRSWIPGLLTLHWKDDRCEYKEGKNIIKKLAPQSLDWNGRNYRLVADSAHKSFYFESMNHPQWLNHWIESRLPQHKADLQTLLKRPGYLIQSMTGLTIESSDFRSRIMTLQDESQLDVFAEQGAWVLPMPLYWKLASEVGVHTLTGFQGTILLDNGSYIKGALLPEELGLEPGIYGGIKWSPGQKNKSATVILASVMTSFAHYPWTASMNRQQTDYCDAWDELPVRARDFDAELVQMALSGFPPYVKQYNNFLIATAGRLFRKINVDGFAGQIALGNCMTPDIQFQVYLNPERHSKFRDRHGEIMQAAWLPNPSLPINRDIACVRIQIVITDKVYDQLIVLNMSNPDFVGNIYMAVGQDDGDGDGSTLDIEPAHVAKAVSWQNVRFHNTLQYKAQDDVPSVDSFTAIDVAFTRSLKAQDIGRGDKLMRRILREYPGLNSAELQTAVTRYIQMAISSSKKYVGDVDDAWNQIWRLIPVQIRTELHDKIDENKTLHDGIDHIRESATDLINAQINLARCDDQNRIERQRMVHEKQADFNYSLESANSAMPEHSEAARELLNLVQDVDTEVYGRMRRKGEELMIMALRTGLSKEKVQIVEEELRSMNKIWKAAGKEKQEEHRGMSHDEAADLIKQSLSDLIIKVGAEIVYAAILVGPVRFSDGLLGRVLSVADLEYLDWRVPTVRLLDGIFIPIVRQDKTIQIGAEITRKELQNCIAHPALLRGISADRNYRIKSIKPFKAAQWLSRSSQIQHNSMLLLHLVQN